MNSDELDATAELDATTELDTTAVLRMIREDLESTGLRKGLTENARTGSQKSAEAVYRSVASLRDLLPVDAQKQLAVCFEWARAGIARQMADEGSPELGALHAAYGYARDVMLETTRQSGA